MVSKALLQKGEEDEEDASKNPHLSKAEHLELCFLSRGNQNNIPSPQLL